MKQTLKVHRIIKELHQEDMAKKLGITTATYNRWEQNPKVIQYGNLLKIAEILKIKVEDIKI